jgi:hypothetical protein
LLLGSHTEHRLLKPALEPLGGLVGGADMPQQAAEVLLSRRSLQFGAACLGGRLGVLPPLAVLP